MYVIANNCMCVAKETHTFQNGDVVYRGTFTNGQGGLVVVNMQQALYNAIEPMAKYYSLQIDMTTNGYKNFNDLVQAAEEQKKK